MANPRRIWNGVILNSLALYDGATLFVDSVLGPVVMRDYRLIVGNICEQKIALLEGKING